MSALGQVLREELAMNPHHDDEGLNRCTCDECVAALQQLGVRVTNPPALQRAFKELSEAAFFLPVPYLDDARVIVFKNALHRMHVAVSEVVIP
jgi:hypothetical protein